MTDLIERIRDFILSDSQLSQKMERVHLTDGRVLFERGDPDSAFYLIQSGQIKIYTCDGDGQEVFLNTLSVGQTLGELALIDGQPHSVTAVSLASSNLLRLSRDNFLKRAYNSAQLSQLLIQLGNQRLHCLIDYTKKLKEWMHLVADSKCDRVVEELEDFDVRGDGVAKSGYLAGILATVADSFKDIVQTVQQLKGSECQLEVKLKLEIDEHQHQQQVEEIVNTDYFSYLVELAERRNTVSNTQKSRENKNKVLLFNQSEIKINFPKKNELARVINYIMNEHQKKGIIETATRRAEFETKIVVKAMENESFRQALINDPKTVYAQEIGTPLPDSLSIEVVEESCSKVYLRLPSKSIETESEVETELSEEALEAVAAGWTFWQSEWIYSGPDKIQEE